HDPEISPATADTPEEVGVLIGARPQTPPIGADDLDRRDGVTGKPVLPHEPPVAAAEGKACDTSGRDDPSGGGESVSLSRRIEFLPREASPDGRETSHRIETHAPHR